MLTTRGDVLFRNATTAARLAASTAGYLLQTNGAGADPAWAGFLQAGTSAVTRTWQTKAREIISVKDFGATGDGTTDDSAAIALAETYRASVGGELIFPPGTYLYGGQAINRANGGGWRGVGECKFIPTANSLVMIDITGAVISAASPIPFSVKGIHFAANSKTGITCIRETAPYFTSLSGLIFTGDLSYAVIFTGGSGSQTGWINIDDIHQRGAATWLFRGVDDSHYIFNVNVSNFNQQGTGAATWAVSQLFSLTRAVSVLLNNINAASLDGQAIGVSMAGDCQGVFIDNVIIGFPTTGVLAQVGTDTLIPAYVYITNCGMDQPTGAGYDINGRTWLMSNINATNGRDRSSTGAGMRLRATATDISVNGALIAYMNNDGLLVDTGAKKVRISGLCSENNNQIAGSNKEVQLNACSFTDVKLFGKNVIGSAGVAATGQRLINGVTSPAVSLNNTPASTTAVTTAEDLMTYSIPAAALQVGQRVRVRAWGTTAANANTKTGRLFFGSTNMGGWTGTLNATGWEVSAEIDITGASAESYIRRSLTTSIQVASGTATEATSGAIVAKFQGQNGTASAGDITCNGLEIEILD
ncbi:glycoside hydrolase family 55 protein [Mesorhizobium sp. ESP7-2]|nr:glycoside hydrolase family 55 protein [Mesorhizobium sp. ESP7-2]